MFDFAYSLFTDAQINRMLTWTTRRYYRALNRRRRELGVIRKWEKLATDLREERNRRTKVLEGDNRG